MSDAALERRTVYYSGRVQGVGFRFATRSVAGRYEVTGYVQNLDDGRVLVIAEGDGRVLDRFLAEVADTMEGYIRHTDVSTSRASGEFVDFGVER